MSMNKIVLCSLCLCSLILLQGCGSKGMIVSKYLNDDREKAVSLILQKEQSLRLNQSLSLSKKEGDLLTLLYLENPEIWSQRYEVDGYF